VKWSFRRKIKINSPSHVDTAAKTNLEIDFSFTFHRDIVTSVTDSMTSATRSNHEGTSGREAKRGNSDQVGEFHGAFRRFCLFQRQPLLLVFFIYEPGKI
jgi:hypothetical protein